MSAVEPLRFTYFVSVSSPSSIKPYEITNIPSSPPRLPRRLLTLGVVPPREKLGFRDSGLPTQIADVVARTVARSTPIPYTIYSQI